jgi:N-methylhydantoinase B/oxoprolinase/acetone carboxylase alpha subunit
MDMKEDAEAERDHFMQAMIAANPGKAKEITEMFREQEEKEELAAMEQFIPESHEEVDRVLADLQHFGISLRG